MGKTPGLRRTSGFLVCEDAVGREPCCCEWEVLLPGEADGLVLKKGLLEAEGAARAWSELQECVHTGEAAVVCPTTL